MTIGERNPEEGGEASTTLPKRSAAEVLAALRAVVDLYHGEALDALAAYYATTCSSSVDEAVERRARRALDRYADLVDATREISTVWALAKRSALDGDAVAVVAGLLWRVHISDRVRILQTNPRQIQWVAAFTEDAAARLRGERAGEPIPASPSSLGSIQAGGDLDASGGP